MEYVRHRPYKIQYNKDIALILTFVSRMIVTYEAYNSNDGLCTALRCVVLGCAVLCAQVYTLNGRMCIFRHAKLYSFFSKEFNNVDELDHIIQLERVSRLRLFFVFDFFFVFNFFLRLGCHLHTIIISKCDNN